MGVVAFSFEYGYSDIHYQVWYSVLRVWEL